MSRLGATLQRAAEWLQPHQESLLSDWVRAVADMRGIAEAAARDDCTSELERLLRRLRAGDVEGLLAEEARMAEGPDRDPEP